MGQKKSNLEDMTLWIPPLWEQDWDAAIRNSDGAEAVLLKSKAFAARLLRQINNLNHCCPVDDT